ncbi:MAG: aspartate carbamoyltransferase [archaeon]
MRLFHVVESQQFDKETIQTLFSIADSFLSKKPSPILAGKIMCSLFYEPSTRTRFSFESAMKLLGGQVISTEAAGMFSSVVKGESLNDTIRVIDDYCDVIVLRHKEEDASEIASKISKVPVINAGSGTGQHPTQSLLDLYTIKKELGRVDNLKVAVVGDLAYGRTVRSLAYMLGKFENNEIFFISPENLRMKEDLKEYLKRNDTKFHELSSFEHILPEIDVIYMTRIQKERMSVEDYEQAKGKLIVTQKELDKMKSSARLMHPLPKINEVQLSIETEENNPKVAYFRQAQNGLLIRMALLKMILE